MTIQIQQSGRGIKGKAPNARFSAASPPQPVSAVLGTAKDGSVTITGLTPEEVKKICKAVARASPSS